MSELASKELPIYDVSYIQKKPFDNPSNKSNKYIFECFDIALKLLKNKKIIGLINCPITKENLFKKKHQGITEFLSIKTNKKESGVMLIYNKKISVSPVTTHIPLNQVSKKIKKNKIIQNVKIIHDFYKKILKKKPSFAILGLNPHNFSASKNSEEKIIISAVKSLVKSNIKVFGPLPADSIFMISKKYKFDVIIGMYHDQVLTPFKALYNFDAINITLGLPFVRISPDHGVAENISGKGTSNPESLIKSIKFFNNIK